MARRKQAKLSLSAQMARIRKHDTGPEKALRKALWAVGVRYRLRYKLPGSPDLVIVGLRLAVFVDGCFWHSCPIHYREPKSNLGYWLPKIERNVNRDRRVNAELAALGWRVLRFWEHEIAVDLPGVVARVLDAIESRKQLAQGDLR